MLILLVRANALRRRPPSLAGAGTTCMVSKPDIVAVQLWEAVMLRPKPACEKQLGRQCIEFELWSSSHAVPTCKEAMLAIQ